MARAPGGFLPRGLAGQLLQELRRAGYRCLGPQVRDRAIVYDEIGSFSELPRGWRDRQAPGEYRLERTDTPRAFAWAIGPQALKPLFFAAREPLWRAERGPQGEVAFTEAPPPAPAAPVAVIGVRACDLAALALQDRHFLHGAYADPYYARRRAQAFLVAVHCAHPADTCFCASTGDGPGVTEGADLVLGELDEGYTVQAGSSRGEEILARLPLEPLTAAQQQAVEREVRRAAQGQRRRLPARNLRATLMARLEHGRWQDVAQRCLSCGNCTSVCPTCFCHSETDEPALDGRDTAHVRLWDSCFTPGHSYIHGIVIRSDTRMRYRQWLVHKLGTWHDQYGRSGCVGCGRCITWCPVGIDITEEAGAICGEAGRG